MKAPVLLLLTTLLVAAHCAQTPTFAEGFADSALGWSYPPNTQTCLAEFPGYAKALYNAADALINQGDTSGFQSMATHLYNNYPRCNYFTNVIYILLYNVFFEFVFYVLPDNPVVVGLVATPILGSLTLLTITDFVLYFMVVVQDVTAIQSENFRGPEWRIGEVLGELPIVFYLYDIYMEFMTNIRDLLKNAF